MLSFNALTEKKTKVKLNPKMSEVMEGGFRATAESGMPITMHSYEKGGKVKKAKKVVSEKNHGEDCDCMKCEKQRRSEDVHDGPDVQNEAKVDKGRSDYGKASIRNYRRMGPGHGDPGMFDPEGKRGKTIDKRREEHKARRGVKGAKVPAYKRESFQRFVECWKTHKKVGMKMKGGKLVPDCRPKNEETKYEVMSKEKYKNTHKDFKGGTKKEPRVSVYDPEKKATVSRLVKFSEAKYERGASNYGKMSIRNKRAVGYGGNAAPPEERRKAHDERMKKHKASQMKEEKHRDAALDAVKKSIIAQYGKGAIMRKGSNQQKKVRGAKSTAGTGKYKKMADQKKQTAADAKKRGFKSVQNYTDTMARYGGKDNYDKGRGLGS